MKKQTELESKIYELVGKESKMNFNSYLKVVRVYGDSDDADRVSKKLIGVGADVDEYEYDFKFEDYTIPILNL